MIIRECDWSGSRIIRNTIIPTKRRVIGNSRVTIPTDIREWISAPDNQEIRDALDQIDLPEDKEISSFDRRARKVWEYVVGNIKYVGDDTSNRHPDFWQFAAETLALRKGDCEDCSFLLASLMISSGISPFCVRVVFGDLSVEGNGVFGHAWPIYKDEKGNWRLLEATLACEDLPPELPLADDLVNQDADPRYIPGICMNQFHVWTVGRSRIGNVSSYLKRKMKKKVNRKLIDRLRCFRMTKK